MRAALFMMLLAACGGSAPQEPEAPACDFTKLDDLTGRSFVLSESKPGNQTVNNPQTRIRFDKDDDGVFAKYTVASLANVYEYRCEPVKSDTREEYVCLSKPDLTRICLAFEAHKKGSCSKKAITDAGFTGSDEELDKAVKEAKEFVAKVAETPQWDRFKLANNNVGNGVQGKIYAKIDADNCRLKFDDLMLIVYNSKVKEDTNPVGSAMFVETKDEYLFEDCPQQRLLVDYGEEALPENLADLRAGTEYQAGAPVWFHYIGEDGVKAKEGCTYGADLWVNWKPEKKGVEMAVDDGKVAWKVSNTFDDGAVALGGGRKGHIVHLDRYATCDGKKERIDVICGQAVVP